MNEGPGHIRIFLIYIYMSVDDADYQNIITVLS